MSTVSHSPEVSPQESGTFLTSRVIERMHDPAEFIRFLNATNKLSDRDFEASVHQLGYRLVTLYQRAGALKADIKLVQACEIYLRRAKACLQDHVQPTSSAGSEAPFSRPQREPDHKIE